MVETFEESLTLWDNNSTTWSVEMGGLGPGYEQAIQVGVMELGRMLLPNREALKVFFLEKRTLENIAQVGAMDRLLDLELRALSSRNNWGLSGAQAGAIKTLAVRFLVGGVRATVQSVPEDQRIQISKAWVKV